MKSAVVYFTRTQGTEKVARQIADNLGADLLKLDYDHDPSGAFGFLRALRDAVLKRIVPIETADWNLGQYDIIVVGSPVWAGVVSAPIRTFLTRHSHQLKTAAFFVTCGGSGAPAVLKSMGSISFIRPVATMTVMAQDIVSGAFRKKVSTFVADIRHGKPIEITGHPFMQEQF